MWTRRRFLTRGTAAGFGLAGTALGFPSEIQDALPDGSAARGMITPEADKAIEAGLSYLKERQTANGSLGTNAYRGNVAVTSLAALAMMAGGSQPGRGPYGKCVTDALKYVLKQEDENLKGILNHKGNTTHGPMYGHGFGTLFLAEVYGMVHEPKLRDEVREKLKGSVQRILASQNKEGGWRYYPTSTDADISVTICQIMALRAARNAGLYIPKAQVDKCVDYVKHCQDRMGGWFRYQAQGGGGGQAFARTAAGVVALNSAGIYLKDKEGKTVPEVEAGLKYLMNNHKPTGQFPRHDMHYFYGHYYAVQAMWTAGGTYWSEWFPSIRDELLRRRANDGSWPDPICVHYGTAMACLILQVPNNYLPILQK